MKTNAKIYVMRAEDGTIKLGHSVNPAKRAWHVGKPVELVHETDTIVDAERVERLAHRVLALHGVHLRGEWFEATVDAAILAIEIATRQAANDELALGGKIRRRDPVTPKKPTKWKQVNILVDDEIESAIREICEAEGLTIAAAIRASIMNLRSADRAEIEAKRK